MPMMTDMNFYFGEVANVKVLVEKLTDLSLTGFDVAADKENIIVNIDKVVDVSHDSPVDQHKLIVKKSSGISLTSRQSTVVKQKESIKISAYMSPKIQDSSAAAKEKTVDVSPKLQEPIVDNEKVTVKKSSRASMVNQRSTRVPIARHAIAGQETKSRVSMARQGSRAVKQPMTETETTTGTDKGNQKSRSRSSTADPEITTGTDKTKHRPTAGQEKPTRVSMARHGSTAGKQPIAARASTAEPPKHADPSPAETATGTDKGKHIFRARPSTAEPPKRADPSHTETATRTDKVKNAFRRVVGRQREIGELDAFICGHFSGGTSANLYVSGSPGTGKTLVVTAVLNDLAARRVCHSHFINCMELRNAAAVLPEIWARLAGHSEQLAGGGKAGERVERLLRARGKGDTPIVVVLDEVDELLKNGERVLYECVSGFDWLRDDVGLYGGLWGLKRSCEALWSTILYIMGSCGTLWGIAGFEEVL